MSSEQVWISIGALTAVSVITRSFFLLFGERLSIPGPMQRALSYAPIGALVGIIVPDFLVVIDGAGMPQFSVAHPEFWGGLVGLLAFSVSRGIIPTVALGMGAYSAARIFF